MVPDSSPPSRAARLVEVGRWLCGRSLPQAYQCAQSAVAEAESTGEREMLGQALNLQASIELDLGLSGLARLHLERAMNLGHELGNAELQVKAANNLGLLCYGQGEIHHTMQHFIFAYERIQQSRGAVSPSLQGRVLVNLAHMYSNWEEPEKALHVLDYMTPEERQGAEIYMEISRISSYLTLARRNQTLGRPEEVQRFLNLAAASLEVAEGLNDDMAFWVIQAERNLARAEWLNLSGEAAQAHDLLGRVLRDSREHYMQGVITALLRLGTHPLTPPPEAAGYLQEALTLCRTHEYLRVQTEILEGLVRLCRQRGDWEQAFGFQEELLLSLRRENEVLRRENSGYLLELRASPAQTSAQLWGLLRQAEQEARTDALTRLPNRRALDETLPGMLERLRLPGHTLHVLLADIDHFKAINDTHSHLVGDEVLRRIGGLFGRVGERTFAARYGGEELLLAAENLTDAEAYSMAETLRRQVAALKWVQFSGSVTISLGLTRAEGGETVAALMERTDEALYRAKAAGRNRTAWATPVQTLGNAPSPQP